MRTTSICAPVFGLVLALCSCAPAKRISLEPPSRPLSAKEYSGALSRWTRNDSIMRQLDTTLRVFATLRSARFDDAYVAKYQDVFKLPRKAAESMRQKLAAARTKSYSFVVVASTHDYDWNDFERRDSNWRLFLLDDSGHQVAPTRVDVHTRPTETDRLFFPHLGTFFRLYEVDFPKQLRDGTALVGDGTKSLTLRFSGALGTAELVWRLRVRVTISPSHRGRRGAPLARREEGAYRCVRNRRATQPAGMDRRPNAGVILARALK